MKKRIALSLALILALTSLPLASSALSGNVSPALAAETRQTAVEIENEGVVLLKNEDGVLPLRSKKINLFGAGSAEPLYGCAGSIKKRPSAAGPSRRLFDAHFR